MQNSKSGMSLVSVMIAFGLMAALGVGLMKLNEAGVSSTKKITTRVDTNLLLNSILQVIENNDRCSLALGGQNFVPGGQNPSVVISEPTGGQWKVGQEVAPGVNITELNLLDTGGAPYVVQLQGASYRRYIAELRIRVKLEQTAGAGTFEYKPQKTLLNVLVDAGNVIRFCNGNERASADQFCIEMGGLYSPSAPPELRCRITSDQPPCQQNANPLGPQATSIYVGRDGMGRLRCMTPEQVVGKCRFGGGYSRTDGSISAPNPATGAACPAGYTSIESGRNSVTTSFDCACGKKGCATCTNTVTTINYTCLDCIY